MYYIYHYIDPRDNLPFYIGKGTANRCFDHLTETAENTLNRHKFYRIQFLIQHNMPPIIKKVIDNIINEDDAYKLETEEILKYGRIGFEENGILTNICLDNKPPSWKNRVKSEEHRKNLSKSHLGKKLPADTKRKIIETKIKNGTLKSGMEGKLHRNETKLKISKSKTGVMLTDIHKEKISKSLKGKPWSEARILAAESQKKTGPEKGKPWSEARLLAHQNKKKHGNN
jgi:hypothetical protein